MMMKKQYVAPFGELILLDEENVLTITVSNEAQFANVNGRSYKDIFQ